MAGKRSDVFLKVMDRIEHFTLQRAWTELTDDEFFWEPTPSTWSVRRLEECRTPTPFGQGDWRVDFGPEPTPAPMTSIAWLLWHVGSMPGRLVDIDFLGGNHAMASGWTSPYLTHHPIFTNAADATTALRDGGLSFAPRSNARRTSSSGAWHPRYTYANAPMKHGLCAIGPPGPEHPATFFVAGTINEVSHHATQICVLRDLYAARWAVG